MHQFLELVKTGVIIFDEESGHIIFRGEGGVIIPVRVLNYLFLSLLELGEKGEEIIRKIATIQINLAMKRYQKVFEIRPLEQSLLKILEMMSLFSESLGFGKLKFQIINENTVIFRINSILAKEYFLEFGKSTRCWDIYIGEIIKSFISLNLQKKVECKEVKCIAKGDEICEFIVKILE